MPTQPWCRWSWRELIYGSSGLCVVDTDREESSLLPPIPQNWAAASSRALLALPSFCAPNDTIKSKISRFLAVLVLAKIQLTVQVWSHLRWNRVCEIICLALVPKLGIAWKQILISLINRDIKSWKARCRDEWRLMRSHLVAITSNTTAVGGSRTHLAVSHTGINQEEVFWSL